MCPPQGDKDIMDEGGGMTSRTLRIVPPGKEILFKVS